MTGGIQSFILVAMFQYYGLTAGPYSQGECEAAKAVLVRELNRAKTKHVTLCLPGTIQEKP